MVREGNAIDESGVEFGEHLTEIILGRPILEEGFEVKWENHEKWTYLDLESRSLRRRAAESPEEIGDGGRECLMCIAVDHSDSFIAKGLHEILGTPFTLQCLVHISDDDGLTPSPRSPECGVLEVPRRHPQGIRLTIKLGVLSRLDIPVGQIQLQAATT